MATHVPEPPPSPPLHASASTSTSATTTTTIATTIATTASTSTSIDTTTSTVDAATYVDNASFIDESDPTHHHRTLWSRIHFLELRVHRHCEAFNLLVVKYEEQKQALSLYRELLKLKDAEAKKMSEQIKALMQERLKNNATNGFDEQHLPELFPLFNTFIPIRALTP